VHIQSGPQREEPPEDIRKEEQVERQNDFGSLFVLVLAAALSVTTIEVVLS